MEKGCKNHRETPQRERLCMLWGNPVIFTDCGENPMITIGYKMFHPILCYLGSNIG